MIQIPRKDYERLLEKASRVDELAFELKQYKSALCEAEKQIFKLCNTKLIDDG